MIKEKQLSYERAGISVHALKMIAITAMFLDHISYLLIPSDTPMNWGVHFIGRIAAPVMCYLIAEGHHHTSNKKRYLGRLLLFALISHAPYVIYFDLPFFGATSIIWSLSMGLVALMGASSKRLPLWVKIGWVLFCCLLAYNANWNYLGVLWIVWFGLTRHNFRLQMTGYTLIGLILYVGQGLIRVGPHVTYRFGFLLPIVLFYFHNGKLGTKTKLSKWSFYIFYPLHLIVLYLLKIWVFNGFI
ncbi:TraX family protein [Alkalibacterium sp. MB6]|uniref:TraX family protein n=1 Tax=Alkalibacterium sp. MB6 TaxID=2081965 RepID=UPI00137A9C9D|nr:TraX family protein [Alkalibacterium sp. MB6]